MSLDFDHTGIFLETETIYTYIGEKTRILGRYESEERAQEIFKEMHEKRTYIAGGSQNDSVYIMPEE